MITLYHNPRCRKSREGLAILEASNKEFKIVKYLEELLSVKELTELITLLNITPIKLVRKTEKIWIDHYKGKPLSDAEIIAAMAKHPKLIERPIVVNNNKAIIGRPPELITALL